MDSIFIEGLELSTIIGCYSHEKLAPQRIVVDLQLAWDVRKAAREDTLEDTLDYDKVCARLATLVQEQQFELVESLAEKIASVLMDEFSVKGLRLRLGKPDIIENVHSVGIVIARGTDVLTWP